MLENSARIDIPLQLQNYPVGLLHDVGCNGTFRELLIETRRLEYTPSFSHMNKV
jgi:hypothetical protein